MLRLSLNALKNMQKEDSNNYKEDVKQIDLKLKNRDQEVDFGNPENEEEEDEK